jgi:uncharacterized oxidoreductase
MKLEGNTILITGGSNGIGLGLAKEFVKRGNTVVVTGRDQGKLDRVKNDVPGLHVVRSDAGSAADVQALYDRMMKEFPSLNVLVNNAGIMKGINVHKEELSLEDMTQEIEVNLKGPIWMVKKFLPHLKKMGEAAIINISSGLAYVPLPTHPIYCCTKAAMHSFTLSLRIQLKKTKVRVFELAPPAVQTDLLTGSGPAEDLKGVPILSVDELVAAAMKGLGRDQKEIRPGQSGQLRFMNRVAPEFILSQLAKPVDRMLDS